MSTELMKSKFARRSSVVRLWQRLSLNLLHAFPSHQIFGCCSPVPYARFFFFFLILENMYFGFFLRISFVFIQHGSKNFKKLFLLQLASENVQTLPDFFSQWSSQHYAWNFWKFLKNEILKIFFSLEPNGIENFNTLFLLQIAAKSFQTWPDFSSQWSSQKRNGDFWNFDFPIFNDFFFQDYLENERS